MRLRLDARGRRMLRRLPVVNVYSVAELALLAGLAVQCARLVWVVATPVSPLGDWRPATPVVPGGIADTLSGFDPFFRLDATQPTSVTPLQLTLFGTRMNEASGRDGAIIAGPDGVQASYALGDAVQPGVTLKAVFFDHVTLDRSGASEDLFLDQSGGAPAPQPGSAAADTIPVGPASGGPAPATASQGIRADQIQQQIAFVPRIDAGRLSGISVSPSGTGDAFRAAGLRPGDVITAIAGRPVTGADDLGRIGRDYASGGNVPITVERGGQTLALTLTIAAPNR